MCNPTWTMVATPSTLTVRVDASGDAIMVASLIVNGGDPEEISPDGIDVQIHAGTLYIVDVQLTTAGRAATATVTAHVSGSDSRGPDTCRLAVDADNPVAADSITVVA